jgi:hypothetical protein
MKIVNILKVAAAVIFATSQTAQAYVKIQSAQYKESKGAVFVKGKVSSATTVYVVNAQTNVLITELSAPRGHFKMNVEVAEESVPCKIQVQTNHPGGSRWFGGASNSNPGDTDVSNVRQAPSNCN